MYSRIAFIMQQIVISGNGQAQGPIRSANWHFTSRCNYHCTFCSTQKLQGDLKSMDIARKTLTHLKRLGIEKLNFVGGEPLCNPLIYDVAKLSKEMGFVVSVTTNGSLLNEKTIERLAPYLDWVGISVDSCSDDVEAEMGRGHGIHVTHALEAAAIVKAKGIKLKINTTVTRLTKDEDMRALIEKFSPDRWKVFQFMHVPGQNDHAVSDLAITAEEFDAFRRRHEDIVLRSGASPVFETEELMLESYLMVAPSGNIFMNNQYPYPEYDIETMTPQMLCNIMNSSAYATRGAIYAWN